MTITLADWAGAVRGRVDPADALRIVTVAPGDGRGSSGAFRAFDEQNQIWWVKPLNNAQDPRVTVTESIVGLVGAVIGAPVCEAAVVSLPSELAGWEFRPGYRLEPGLAHGSRAVEAAHEVHLLHYPNHDDNARRHAGVLALYDWCWGGDGQWLYSITDDQKVYSHDHGWYFPDTGPTWSIETLVANVDRPSELPSLPGVPDPDEIRRLCATLRSTTRAEIAEALQKIPVSWPVSDDELEGIGWFLERRLEPVAARLEYLGGAR